MLRKYVVICLVCALWTIVQTSFHLTFVIFSYFLGICERTPYDANSIFFYLTYLYSKDCPVPELKLSPVPRPESYIFHLFSGANSNTNVTVEEVVKLLLQQLNVFPPSSGYSSRTSVFLLCFLILDGAWIVSAVSLLMGISFGIKEGLSLVFYGPWLVMTICVGIFDATATVFFGFDVSHTLTVSQWRDFVGITANINLPPDTPQQVLASPSMALASISSRFVLIWFSNWVAFAFVMKATISVYHESYKTEAHSRPRSFVEEPARRPRVDADTSAARIRSWQLFYGAVDATSTRSSKSVESERDLNANREASDSASFDGDDATGAYYGYTDVAESVVGFGEVQVFPEELRGQLPWSYTRPVEENFDLEKKGKKFRLRLDSSNSGTEL